VVIETARLVCDILLHRWFACQQPVAVQTNPHNLCVNQAVTYAANILISTSHVMFGVAAEKLRLHIMTQKNDHAGCLHTTCASQP
jgi:hypothetical protein